MDEKERLFVTALRAIAAFLIIAGLLAAIFAAMAIAVYFIRVILVLAGVAAGALTIRGIVSRVNRLGNPQFARRPPDVP